MKFRDLFFEAADPSTDRTPVPTSWKGKAAYLGAGAGGWLIAMGIASRFGQKVSFPDVLTQVGGFVLGTFVAMLILERRKSPG